MALDGQAWYLASTVRFKLHYENTLDTVFSYLHEGKTGRRDTLKLIHRTNKLPGATASIRIPACSASHSVSVRRQCANRVYPSDRVGGSPQWQARFAISLQFARMCTP